MRTCTRQEISIKSNTTDISHAGEARETEQKTLVLNAIERTTMARIKREKKITSESLSSSAF